MQLLVDAAKEGLRIGSPVFLIGVLAAGAAMLFVRRLARAARWWLAGWAVVLVMCALPAGARLLTAPLARGYRPINSRAEAANADVIVMLGAGVHTYAAAGLAVDDLNTSALRVLETARLYHLLQPRKVIVSGGNTADVHPPRAEAKSFEETLLRLGVPHDRILVEDQSQTTRDEVVLLQPMLQSLGATTFVLVTSPAHMRRSMRAFEAAKLKPIPSTSALFSEDHGIAALLPTRDALIASDAALYEYGATMYYWARGWI